MIGTRQLPCGHQYARIPDEPGMYQRRCNLCKQVYTATVGPAHTPVLAMTGILRIDWQPA